MSLEPQYVPITAADVDDLHLLPRRFDAFAAECRDNFRILAERFLPSIDRLNTALDEIAHRQGLIERHQVAQDKITADHAKRLAELEAESLIAARRRRKAK